MLRKIKFLQRIGHISFSADMASEVQRIVVSKDDEPDIEIVDLPHSKYGGVSTVTLLTGTDEIGKLGADFMQSIFEHINAPIQLELLTSDTDDSDEFMLSTMRNGSAIQIETTHLERAKRRSLMLNTRLDLYAAVVNFFSTPGFNSKFENIDIALVMQNNRGDFAKMEYEPVKGVVETLKIDHTKAIKRYMEYAFTYAIQNNRKRITFGHKSLELPLSDGLHVKTAKMLNNTKYPHIHIDFMFINQLIRNLTWDAPSFDVVCLSDKYGTFAASVIGGICGGAHLFSASEISDQYAIFKPLQTKLSIQSDARLSPYGCVVTAVNLLKHLGYDECASKLWRGLLDVMVVKKLKTKLSGGDSCEEDVIDCLLDSIHESVCRYN